MPKLSIATLLLLVLRAAPAAAGSLSVELEEMVRTAPPGVRIPVVVPLAEQADASDAAGTLEERADRLPRIVRALKEKAVATQDRPGGCGEPGLLAQLVAAGATNVRPLWAVNAVAADATPATIETCALRGDVGEIAYAGAREVAEDAGVPSSPQWNLTRIRAPEAWALGFTGTGAVVATIDTGASGTHPDLAANLLYGATGPVWHDAVYGLTAPYDDDGHGSHLLGIAVGRNGVGVAPGARWMACKAFTRSGGRLVTTLPRILECAQWVLDPDHGDAGDATPPDPAKTPDVVLSDLVISAAGVCDPLLRYVVRAWRAAGILPVFSVGDDPGIAPADAVPSPANDPAVFSVGAADASDAILPGTYRGTAACDGPPRSAPRLVAPGVDVVSTWTTGRQSRSGSAVAAAHVAGAAALVRGARPDLRRVPVDVLDDALVRAGVAVGGGQRRLDVLAAVTLEDAAFVSQLPPGQFVLTGEVVPVTVTMRNAGVTTWVRGAHRLRYAAPNLVWGVDTVDLPDGVDVVLPGESIYFGFTVSASSVEPLPGELFQWRMDRAGAGSFGQSSVPVHVGVDGYDGAAFIQQTVSCAPPGQLGSASIRFRNTGTNSWTRAGAYRLGKLGTYGDPPLAELGSSEVVLPGTEKSFTLNFSGPAPAGRYTFQRRMKVNNTWFGEAGPARLVDTNTCSPSDSAIAAVSDASELRVGAPATLWLRFTNTGLATWRSGYCLRAGEGTFWGPAAAAVCLGPSETVGAGAERTFAVPIVAPAVPGRWAVTYQMYDDLGNAFGAKYATTIGIPRDHQASVEWSFFQGAHNWFYRYYSASDSGWRRMAWTAGTHWHGSQPGQDVWPQSIHPGPSSPAGRFWKSPIDGWIRASGQVADLDNACGDGVVFRIRRNKDLVFEQTLDNGAPSFAFAETIWVDRDDTVRFIVRPRSANGCDSTLVDPLVQVLPPAAPAVGAAPDESHTPFDPQVEPGGD
jgi:Subtilase family/Ig-like domain from next to BRCA1 gene